MKDLRQRAFVRLIGLISAGLISSLQRSTTTRAPAAAPAPAPAARARAEPPAPVAAAPARAAVGPAPAARLLAARLRSGRQRDNRRFRQRRCGRRGDRRRPVCYPRYAGLPGARRADTQVTGGALHVTDTVAAGSAPQYVAMGIYFSGNAGGTDCTDAHTYTSIPSHQGDPDGQLHAAVLDQRQQAHRQCSTTDSKAGGPTGWVLAAHPITSMPHRGGDDGQSGVHRRHAWARGARLPPMNPHQARSEFSGS